MNIELVKRGEVCITTGTHLFMFLEGDHRGRKAYINYVSDYFEDKTNERTNHSRYHYLVWSDMLSEWLSC